MEKLRAKLSGRALPASLLTIFIDALGVSILVPIYPLLVLPGHEKVIPAAWSIRDGYIMLGWLTAIYSLCTFLAAPILGQLSDKYGRKKILGASLAGTAFGYALFAIGIATKNIPLLFVSRAIDGITGGNIAIARAVIGDISDAKTRTRNFGLIGAMFGLGFVLGPYIGGKLAIAGTHIVNIGGLHLLRTPHWFNAATPFWFATIIAIIDVFLVLFLLPETLRNKSKERMHWAKSFINIKKAVTLPGLRTIFPSSFLMTGGFTFFTTFFGLNLIARIPGFKPSNVADFFSYIGLWIVITQAVITMLVAKKFKNHQVVRVALPMLALAILAQTIPHSTPALLAISPLIAIFVGLNMANTIALVSHVAGPEIQGEAMGINSSVEALAQGIPAAISGYVASVALGLPVYVASITVGLAAVTFWVLFKPKYIKQHGHYDEQAMMH